MITFHLDDDSGLSPYLQLVRQIRYGVRLGWLREGDQLPTVKDLAGRLGINPNTVLKAYRELDYSGLVSSRPGVGTFIKVTLADGASLTDDGSLLTELKRWLTTARAAGVDDEGIEALFVAALHAI